MLKNIRGWNTPHWRRVAARAVFCLPTLIVIIAGFPDVGRAQSLGGSTDILQQVQQRLNSGSDSISDDSSSQENTANTPNMQMPDQLDLAAPPLPISRLERIMSSRAGVKLVQFGYDQFGRGRPVAIPQTGAVQDDYILGPGDQIVVTLRGQENSQFRTTVDRNGQIVLSRLPPISATGRSFGSFRQDLEIAVHRAYVATDAFVSIGRVRQISVLVSGEVNNPGQRFVTGLSSVVDALLLSGGVKKTGSLRDVRIQRGAHGYSVDLYAVLTGGAGGANLRLMDGDRIVVPPLGPTVAVTGLVRLPGIYELSAHQSGVSVRALLALAGGQEVRGRYRLSLLRIDADGSSSLVALNTQTGLVRDSEILFVQLGANQTASQATLSGGTGLAGTYPVTAGTRLADVLREPGAMGTAPYTLFGIIVRKDPHSLLRSLVAFTPVAVLNGTENEEIQTDDMIRVLSVSESSLLSNVVRVYLEKLAADQAILRNPLMDQNVTAVTPALPPVGNRVPGGEGAAIAAGVSSSVDASTAASSTLPLSKVDELSFALNDLTSAPPDVQRANILSLMDLRAPGTLAAGSTESLAEQQDQTGIQPPSRNDMQNQSPQNDLPSSPAMPGNVATSFNRVAGEPNVYPSSQPPPVQDNPALNFQDAPLAQGRFASNREVQTFGELVRQLNVDPLVLINFLIEQRARLDGAVRGPGSYFVGPNATLNDLVQAAGGTINWADQSGIELITTAVDPQTGHAVTQRQTLPLGHAQLASYIVRPRDTLRFNQIFTDVGIGAVTVQGEIRSAGSYPIIRGEHLSELLARAGGLTNTAYPYGTVFLRKSAAQAEHDGYIRDANEIENELVDAMTRVGNDKIDPGSFGSLQAFVAELRNQKAVGRIAIIADPSVLAAKPELDPLLEAGDLVYIPQRSSTVAVLGQVAQPGSFPYRPGMSVQDYIDKAGGYSAISDDSMTFIVLPDGTARKVEKSWLSFSADNLPPGSTIVVPRDVTPLDTRQLILDVSSIFSQFAVSIASMAVLAKDN